MPFSIRPFLNTDINAMESTRQAHLACTGCQSVGILDGLPISASRLWEDYILGKAFFDPNLLWVCEEEGRLIGYLHGSPLGDESGKLTSNSEILLNACCVRDIPHASEVAKQLIATFEGSEAVRRCSKIIATSSPTKHAGYIGIGPGSGRLGVVESDQRLARWIMDAGYEFVQKNLQLRLQLSAFRPPMDRIQIQTSRQWNVQKIMTTANDTWWEANAYSHVEGVDYYLTDRRTNSIGDSICVWQMTGPIAAMEYGIWDLKVPSHLTGAVMTEDVLYRLRYLISETVRQLQTDGSVAIDYFLKADDPMNKLLQPMGFKPVLSGSTFVKTL